MLPDYHVHTEFSGDSKAPIRDQINRAIELGMNELCITDHHDYDVISKIDFILAIEDYIPTIQSLKAEYKDKIELKLGIELGLQPHLKSYFEQLLPRYSFDFVIGSVHFVHGMDPYYPPFYEGRTETEAYRDYFEMVLDNATQLDCYDILGHIDYVVRYGPNGNKFYSYKAYKDILDEILKVVIKKGKGIECNTGGFKYQLGQPNPDREVLKRYFELGGEMITFGSDAHEPNMIGYEFERSKNILKSCGFKYFTTFKNRKPNFLPL